MSPNGDGQYVLAQEEMAQRYSIIRDFAGRIVNDTRFQVVMIALIVINSILMGIATFDFVTEDPKVNKMFDTLDLLFLIAFTIELSIYFACYGVGLFADAWMTFDFTVILFSWVFFGSPFQVIRAFRIVRAFRLITRIKELKQLVEALLSVIPRMFAIGTLLLLVLYVYAVMFTQLFKELYEEGFTSADYFSRMDKTMFTLFRIMTLDSWADITLEVMQKYKWAWIPFMTFVGMSSFIVINLIIAVICDAVSSIQTNELSEQLGNIQKKATGDRYDEQSQLAQLKLQMDEVTTTLRWLADNQRQQYSAEHTKLV